MAAIQWLVELKIEVTVLHDPVVETKEEAVDATVEWIQREYNELVFENVVAVVRAAPDPPRRPRDELMS